MSKYGVIFGPCFSVFGLNTGKYGPEITPHLDTFHAVMCTKYIQNVYHISTNFCVHFVYKIKRIMADKFCIQNLYKSLSKCGIHFVYKHFVYILYWSTRSADLHHKNYVYNLYTKFIQNVYTNNCMQNGSHISTYFDPFVVHFLAS